MNIIKEHKLFSELNFGDCFRLDDDFFIKTLCINTKNQDLMDFTAESINCVNLTSGLPDYVNEDTKVEVPNVKIIMN